MKSLALISSVLLVALVTQAQTEIVNRTKIKSLVEEWNLAHNEKDVSGFEKLYASNVLFYCQQLSRQECLKKKSKLFSTYQKFDQKIISKALVITAYTSGIIKCDFTKEVTFNSKTKQYPSYLLLRKFEDGYVIVGESDEITDHNLKYKLNLGSSVDVRDGDNDISATPKTNDKSSNYSDRLIFVTLGILFGILLLVIVKGWREKKSLTHPSSLIVKKDSSPPYVIRQTEQTVAEPIVKYERTSPVSNDQVKLNLLRNAIVQPLDNFAINKKKGDDFETYITDKFDPRYFELKVWRSDKRSLKFFPKSNTYPDFRYKFSYNDYKAKFAVECKFRTNLFNGCFELDEDQLNRYRAYQNRKSIAVYLVLGLGNVANAPEELFIVPLEEVSESKLNYSLLQAKYKKDPGSNFFFNRDVHRLT